MEHRITINENAYFYLITTPMPKKVIEKIVTEATRHKAGAFTYKNIRKSHTVGGQVVQTSLAVFKYEAAPTFITPGSEKEIKYGYLLLVEYGNYLVISKRATQDFHKPMDSYITELPYNSLTKFRVDGATTFPKASMSNLDNGKNVLRRIHLEATDVKEVLSTVTASNKVLYNFRLKNPGKETAIAVGTSRINDLGPKIDYNVFCLWVVRTCNGIAAYRPSANFIDNFAEPLTYATRRR